MDTKELDGKTLYFETFTHPEDKSALFFTQGFVEMRASGNSVSVSWLDYPGASSAHAITFGREEVAKFKRNDERKSFTLHGESKTPDYIYRVDIDERTAIAARTARMRQQ